MAIELRQLLEWGFVKQGEYPGAIGVLAIDIKALPYKPASPLPEFENSDGLSHPTSMWDPRRTNK
jgi:hypothetical protein